ncbi:hypothetical protein K4K96_13975 [Phaeobacter inhibens]|uniref:hypothetical protein n=1 Tax=Phaeobacter inhibens TaxID=221822 RepID=UPI0021A93B25|nr:hypothetical protein [Phaeobacter inhibens]UWR91797.1 hypothetical protein K4K96_13975 [Phaeobacter inhibens]
MSIAITFVLGPVVRLPIHLIEEARHPILGYVAAFLYLVFRTLFLAGVLCLIFGMLYTDVPFSDGWGGFFSENFADLIWLGAKGAGFFAAVALAAFRLQDHFPNEEDA